GGEFVLAAVYALIFGRPDWPRLLAGQGAPHLLLAHNPDHFYEAERHGVPLTLSVTPTADRFGFPAVRPTAHRLAFPAGGPSSATVASASTRASTRSASRCSWFPEDWAVSHCRGAGAPIRRPSCSKLRRGRNSARPASAAGSRASSAGCS